MDRWRSGLIAWISIVALGVLLGQTTLVERVELQLYDQQQQLLRQHAPIPSAVDVALIGIDEATVQSIEAPMALWHEQLAGVIQAMASAEAAVLGFDMVLPERSFDSFLGRPHDQPLMRAMVAARRAELPVVFGRTVAANGKLYGVAPRFQAVMGRDGFGMVLQVQELDSVVRRFNDNRFVDSLGLNTLAGQMARRAGLPVVDGGWIDFTVGEPIGYVSMQQVLDWHEAGAVDALREHFSGRAVFVGVVLPFVDRHTQPLVLADWESNPYAPGVLIHMQVYRALATGRMIDSVPWWIYALLFAAAGSFVFIGDRPLVASAGVLLFTAGVAGASTWAFQQGYRLEFVPVILTALMGWLVRVLQDMWVNLRDKRRMRSAFGGYVSPQILTQILDGSISPELGGESREIALLFADICGFTTLSESNDAHAVLSLLNRYFDRVTPAIHEFDGTLDKYMGDGIMAFFGAPQDLPNPAQNAFNAARKMHEELDILNAELALEGIAPLQIGVGLELGPAIVGHVGAQSRFEYSAIGDAVNVGARVEGLTRSLDCRIALTESVERALSDADRAELVSCGRQEIKGHTPIEVFAWGTQHTASNRAERPEDEVLI